MAEVTGNNDASKASKLANDGDISVQNPLPVGGDRIYCQNLKLENCDIGDFSGEVCDLFDNYDATNVAKSVATGGVNPKSITLAFEGPIASSTIGVGSPNASISNLKVSILTIDGSTVKVIDTSTDNTKRGVQVAQFEQKFFIGVLFEFYTDDEVTLGGMGIFTARNVTIDAINGIVSPDNSTIVPLAGDTGGADHIFTGTAIDTKNYGIVVVTILSDAISAIDGLDIQFSYSPAGPWFSSDSYSLEADKLNTLKPFSVQTVLQFMRVIYTNGLSAQSIFVLQTQLKPVYIKPSSHRLADELSGQDDAELVKAGILGPDQFGVFKNGRMTEVGALLTSNFLVEVSRGNIPGYSAFRKFGYNPSITTATADVYEWGQTVGAYNYTFSADGVADIDRISSDNNADTHHIHIDGLDIDGNQVIQEIDLTGQTPVPLTTSLWRVNRVYNDNATATLGNVYVFVNGATTLGVPNDVTSVRGYFSIANQQTLQAIYTIPNGKIGYFYGLRPSIVKKQAASAIYTGKIKEFGKVSRTQDVFGLTTTGTSKTDDIAQMPVPIPGKSDFIPNVDPDSTIGFSLAYQILLIDN